MLDDRNLRVTLQHPVPWLDELAAFPVAAPAPPRRNLYSGPFRIASRSGGKLVLERNFNYWNAGEVKPSRLVLSTDVKGADAVLPRQLAGPGLPWIDTAGTAAPGADELPLLATGLLGLVTRGTPLADLGARQYVAWVITHLDLGTDPVSLVPPAMPGANVVNSHAPVDLTSKPRPLALTLSWAEQDRGGSRVAAALRREDDQLRQFGLRLTFRPVPTLAALEEQDAELLATPAGQEAWKANSAEAEKLFLRSLELNRLNANAHRGLGMLYEKLNRKPEAASEYAKYLELAPSAIDTERVRRRLAVLRESMK